ncbi:hypothetical protein E3P92_00401 [Wallemia ichthyophaga]|uniref:RRM domain-containing protein n=2 Tax=Wallemia ichthyophaga TaxID=245174 RepID=A0A4T0HXC4_WALIC|nr:Sporulation-specific protein 5 [Wallemia ichthyophaga EXF-994]TIA74924.1 hypothetical protein E3P91_00757 [Wallemia ichthyophaga]EOR00972.1 Sporulation-specific protein 5 [Wallemia ichthyophaga EXF-994]TIA81622.1 hypothetical protein E3P98_01937 [Wallemia ichthyophaga]TIA94121.1 hypothetical protein E3P97_00363 [Wallemia ichthyophaga]TIB03785.1 hypothetical protein E3P95_00467 [Wallemia ichthyophaga]
MSYNEELVAAFNSMGFSALDSSSNGNSNSKSSSNINDILEPRISDKRSLSLPDTTNSFYKAVFPYSYTETQNSLANTQSCVSYPFVNTTKPKPVDKKAILNNPSLDNPLNTSNVFIQGLSPLTTPEELQKAVDLYGRVSSARVIMQPNKKACKGYGFVQFVSTLDAHAAIIALNSKGVNAAFAKQESFTARLRRLEDEESTNLYLSNLPLDMNDGKLSLLFYPANIQSMRVLKSGTGESRGVGFVRVKDRHTASFFIDKLHGMSLPGSDLPLQVRFADSQSQKDFKKYATGSKHGLKNSTSMNYMNSTIRNDIVETAFNKAPLPQLQTPQLKHSQSYESLGRTNGGFHYNPLFEDVFNVQNSASKVMSTQRKPSFDPFSEDLVDLRNLTFCHPNDSQPSLSHSNSSNSFN